MTKIIRVTSSPWPADYQGKANALPWEYSTENFKAWVWEVLLDMGKMGGVPRNADEAIDIAEGAGYEVEILPAPKRPKILKKKEVGS